jgi:hypothetical protein
MPSGPEASGRPASPLGIHRLLRLAVGSGSASGARSAGQYQSIDRYHPTIDSSPGIWFDRNVLRIASRIARLNCLRR